MWPLEPKLAVMLIDLECKEKKQAESASLGLQYAKYNLRRWRCLHSLSELFYDQ
jgi:hypothetical protein